LTTFDGLESQVRDWFRRLGAATSARPRRSSTPTTARWSRWRLRTCAPTRVRETWVAALAGIDRFRGRSSIEELPVAQRRLIAMRDIGGLGADEVCDALGLSAGNHRVPLHRARSRVRAALEVHLDG
jgi:DNA-directed RNA polymerase specialized sigma24 family protein